MVFIGNVFKAHQDLHDGFELNLFYKSGRTSKIMKSDKLEKYNGDLKLTRYFKGEFLCQVIIDCNEIESIVICKEKEV